MSNDRRMGILVSWGSLHLVGLTMHLNGQAGPDNFAYQLIFVIWMAELILLAIFLFALSLFYFSKKHLENENPPVHPILSETRINNHEQPPKETNPAQPTDLDVEPPQPTSQQKKKQAILQILNREEN